MRNGQGFGEGIGFRGEYFERFVECFIKDNLYKAEECLKYMEKVLKESQDDVSGQLPASQKQVQDFHVIRELMDHYFYRMTSQVTDADITAFLCGKGKRKTGMAFYSSPWASPVGVPMDSKWFPLSCQTYSEGVYIGGGRNTVDVITHYAFDQLNPPVALGYDPLALIYSNDEDEHACDTRNFILMNRTITNH